MVLPFRRKDKDEEKTVNDEDEDINALLNTDSQDNSISREDPPEPTTDEERLHAISDMVIQTCMDIRRGENVLIVCDPTTAEIGQSLHIATQKRSERVLLVVMPKSRHHGEEPPTPVAALMRQQQVVIAATKYSLTHTKAVRQALKDGARIATMPGMNFELYTEGGMTADFQDVKRRISNITNFLRRRRIINVKSESGTDITFEVNWRDWKLDDNGICNRPRMLTNLPAGKVFILPKEGTMNGTIVIDGSWDSTLIDEPVELIVEDGTVVDVKGGSLAATIRQSYGEVAKKLKAKDRESVWTVAEFGFGMNPSARLVGNVLEDEKRMGSCYFSIGDNSLLGGSSHAGIHVSGVIAEPTVWLDDTCLTESGEFMANEN
ncbi:MAG: 2,5-dihydroxypyridine 5,6-dioxygenase [Euryarchaeota archaeon UBA443]|jgi:leucyl aminopeptidase (aminopeptidase T)|nr:MAG: 2,5-dihydroxypyridine 5,6-dioxygenase [Euryarchaeota archaeon UBA443]|tara:strand:+ start:2425 stop:3555 length:1131 start_codon:yes stop_codon:yes gene_type:complete